MKDDLDRPRRARRAGFVAAALFLIALLTALTWSAARSVAETARGARREMLRGKELFVQGNLRGAAQAFSRAEAAFGRARSETEGPLLGVIARLPILGRSPDSVRALAASGMEVAAAGRELALAVLELPGGVAALAPQDGAFPLERLQGLAAPIERARARVDGAIDHAQRIPAGLLLGGVGKARNEAIEELGSLRETLSAGSAVLERLPALLGADGPRTYFFAAQNPAELRGTGGIMGAYSILEVDKGRFEFRPFRPIQELTNFPSEQVPPPNADYGRIYEQWGGAGFWLNLNMTPDFPSVASAIETLYRKATGKAIDGVVVADPGALRALLEHTGPVRVPALDIELDETTIVPFTTNEAYSRFPDPAVRKLVLGEVARNVLERFLQGASGETAWLPTLRRVFAEGSIKLASTDPSVQRILADGGAGGGLGRQSGDFLSIVQNNAAGNKVDYYLDRQVDYAVKLHDRGAAVGTTTVRLRNGAPRRGLVPYVIGPYPGVSGAGENISIVHLYCPAKCRLVRAARDGKRTSLVTDHELAHRFFQSYLRIPSGARTTMGVSLEVDDVWTGNDAEGIYRLTYLNQATIRPTRLHVRITVPDGARVVSTDPPMRVSQGVAEWTGALERRTLEIEVRFRRSIVQRLWRSVVRFLGQPVFSFGPQRAS